jgi:hypothetical protein
VRLKISLTWDEWWPHWFDLPTYLGIGIGPVFIEFDWGKGAPLWEQ